MSEEEVRRRQFVTPSLEQAVPGPRGESGLLLRAPHDEALVWDLESEITAARRIWIPEKEAWWIATSYLDTVVALVLRTFPSVLVFGTDEDRLISRDGLQALQGRLF